MKKRTNQTNQLKHFFICCHIKFQYQLQHSYKPHMDLFSISITTFISIKYILFYFIQYSNYVLLCLYYLGYN